MASSTKPVMGVAIMMLIEEGKVRLTDPVSKFIPEFKGLKVAVEKDGGGRTRRGGARDHHPRPADPHLGPGQRRARQAEGAPELLRPTEARRRWPRRPPRGVPLDFQPGRAGYTARRPGRHPLARRRDHLRAALRRVLRGGSSSRSG